MTSSKIIEVMARHNPPPADPSLKDHGCYVHS